MFGEVNFLVKIGPQVFEVTFFIMDINPSYCCLLRCPLIHGAGAVTSTLHQKLKFLLNGKVATICGEKDYIVSHLSSFHYVGMEGEIHEPPCQAFETVQVVRTPRQEVKKSEVSMSS